MTQLSIRVVERNDALDIAAASPTPKLGDVRVTGQTVSHVAANQDPTQTGQKADGLATLGAITGSLEPSG
jgi:hypothetical protein